MQTTAEVVLPGEPLEETLSFFTERLGFRIEAISPADGPTSAVIFGFGLRIRLQCGVGGAPGLVRIRCDERGELTAPNGTRIEFTLAEPPLRIPPLRSSFVLSRLVDADWSLGRAGMQYRDLIPGRQGGRFIASHIKIPDGGEVPDYVHFHEVRFQMIFCYRGWVRVVYEDQGPPFVLNAGECVLQPPRIRHRVLESSPGLEVIEIGCPADHETFADHDVTLPTGRDLPERVYGGQRFTRDYADIAAASENLAAVEVLRPAAAAPRSHAGELLFNFVLEGRVALECEGRELLGAGDAFVIPPQREFVLAEPSPDLEVLEVRLPG